MRRSSALSVCAILAILVAAQPVRGQDTPAPQAPAILKDIRITGTKELSQDAVRRAIPASIGQPLTRTPEQIAEAVAQRYQDDGYTFARVTASFDASTGTLTLTIDEGVIDRVEFQGVEDKVAARLVDEFALRAGDVFNRARARQALDALLRPTRGAIRPARLSFFESPDAAARRGTFGFVDRNGQRVLLVGVREPAGRFRIVPDLGDREDWFSAVDGLVPSLGMGAAVFDHNNFNHAYVAGHISIRTATSRVGYALGFERPFFQTRKVYVGGEVHDLTASDDQWQVSSLEASVDAMFARKSFRDYYRRRGVQIGGAVRVHPQAEVLIAWRGERQELLASETDFSVFNSDEPFRPNRPARPGRLNAIVIGASLSGESFDRESLESSYLRHQIEKPFGERLNDIEARSDLPRVWRIDWTSEVSAPDALGSDFDFTRHILSARTRIALSPHQTFGARAIGGFSGGVLPPQRQFSIGGIGSVHGYEFKAATGDTLALVNLEYGLGWRNAFELVGFFDAGRASVRHGADAFWLKGIGFGLGAGDARIDFGYKLNDIPGSLQVLLRFARTF